MNVTRIADIVTKCYMRATEEPKIAVDALSVQFLFDVLLTRIRPPYRICIHACVCRVLRVLNCLLLNFFPSSHQSRRTSADKFF